MADETLVESTAASAPAKSHYVILDGLRGVAAVMVVIFHLFEPWSHGDAARQVVNHGYLAVDFFFMLSGFVIAYAYDDRWSGGMTRREFFKRRLVRLQPMVAMGSLIGASLFYLQAFPIFPNVAATPGWQVLLACVLGALLIPVPPAMDIRGWGESYPLNGPAWSLFYEYIANLLYALWLRRLPTGWLLVLTLLAAALLVDLAVFGARGDVIGGWSLDAAGLRIGFSRMLFPFLAGVLLMRAGTRIRSNHGFAICALLLVAALSLPRMGAGYMSWLNGLYEAGCIIVLFPLIVAIGAGEKRVDGLSVRIARFFGALSYPLYITHYPLTYLYTGWVISNDVPPGQGALVAVGVFAAAILIALASLALYDRPVRRWLAARFLKQRPAAA